MGRIFALDIYVNLRKSPYSWALGLPARSRFEHSTSEYHSPLFSRESKKRDTGLKTCYTAYANPARTVPFQADLEGDYWRDSCRVEQLDSPY
jgi:hypothetical protein